MSRLQLALAQINPSMGDVQANIALINAACQSAASADLLVFPELAICGYPPEDLLHRPEFINSCKLALEEAAKNLNAQQGMLIGAPHQQDGQLFNAAFYFKAGKACLAHAKQALPNYGVFDERRYFTSATFGEPLKIGDFSLGVMICEDMWLPDMARHLTKTGADILLVLNASPYETGKAAERLKQARDRVAETGLSLIYLNQLGGQDGLVFDGASFVLNAEGEMLLKAAAFKPDLLRVTLERNAKGKVQIVKSTGQEDALWPDDNAQDYAALCLALRDYAEKNKFKSVLLGLSGGLDSAFVATLAADALGADAVHAVMLPSPYTAQESLRDAAACAENLGCHYQVLPIEQGMSLAAAMLSPLVQGNLNDVTAQNLQSRLRGLLLMALSNQHGHLLLATGNKSEMAMGYATLYGDMCGGFAPIKDVYKTKLYALARWRNAKGAVIPENILTRAPTAELKPEQKDEDNLPPYALLDEILEALIERDESVFEVEAKMIAKGAAAGLVASIWQRLNAAEYKRRQAPPGPKISRRDLTRDRRYPITNSFSGNPAEGLNKQKS